MTAAETIYAGGTVLTMDPSQPEAGAVAIRDGHILAVGGTDVAESFRGPDTILVDCRGQTLVPGFHDAHCHLLASSAALLSIQCGPDSARSIQDIRTIVAREARRTAEGSWIRGVGYNEFHLEEKRHPARRDLDDLTPNPVRLLHRSGHAMVVNSAGLRALGIEASTEDPPGGYIERDDHGDPTGVLYGAIPFWNQRIPRIAGEKIRAAFRLLMEKLLATGIVAVQDATATNSFDQWRFFEALDSEGDLPVALTMMIGAGSMGNFMECGYATRLRRGNLSLGPVKIVVDESSGDIWPASVELRQMVLSAHAAGFQTAQHAVQGRALEAAIDALTFALKKYPTPHRHRIEHCSLCPPSLIRKLRRSGATVVTQPGFLYSNGERYLGAVPSPEQPYLYPIASFQRAGVLVAAGSDSPVGEFGPLAGISAAVTRQAANGQFVALGEAISAAAALEAYTRTAAFAAYDEDRRGSITAGKQADFVILDTDPTRCEPEAIRAIRILRTVVRGAPLYEA